MQSISLEDNVPFLNELREVEKALDTEIFIVGGTVRDIILGKEIKDIDIVSVKTDYALLAKKLSKKIKCGAVEFKDNFRLTKNGIIFDVSKLRGETLADDLLKRDFTINNIACSLKGDIIGDQSDLNNKIIRMADVTAFDDDPLRVLRGYRFFSTHGFMIEEKTKEMMNAKKHMLDSVASERIHEELAKLCSGENFIKSCSMLMENKVVDIIYGADFNIDMQKFMTKLKIIKVEAEDIFIILSAYLLYLTGTPDKFIDRLCLSKKSENLIRKICRGAKFNFEETVQGERALNDFVYDNGGYLKELLLLRKVVLDKFDILEIFRDKALSVFEKMNFEAGELVNGNNIMDMGLKGADIGKALDYCKRQLIFNEVETAQEALKNTYKKFIQGCCR